MVGSGLKKSGIHAEAVAHDDVFVFHGGVVPKPGDSLDIKVFTRHGITAHKPNHLHVGLGERTRDKSIQHAVVWIIQHEGQGAHLIIPGAAIVVFDVAHQWRHWLAVLAAC